MKPYFRNKTNGDYAPFKRTESTGYKYDLRLEKDGVTANIMGKIIVSFDSDDMSKVDCLTEELKNLGFNLPE